ncbi:MAG TPA: orotate phosphoribosyltransferase [Gemmatimonadales bacterium]|nr:orotate phosphoribosyltransferase [Gemmatimonadales bacterium]
MTGERAALAALLHSRSIRHGDFILASGQHSTYYVDARRTTMSAEGLDLIGRLGLRAIRAAGWAPAGIGGLTMGADPVAYAVALASLREGPVVQAFSVRKAAKEHGTRQRIEGNFTPGEAVVVAEDVITSGSSALQAVAAAREAGGTVLGVLAVVDRQQGGRAAIEAAGVGVTALFTAEELGLGGVS